MTGRIQQPAATRIYCVPLSHNTVETRLYINVLRTAIRVSLYTEVGKGNMAKFPLTSNTYYTCGYQLMDATVPVCNI